MNIVEILKDCPKGTKLYSLVDGEVFLSEIINNGLYPIKVITDDGNTRFYTKDGKFFNNRPSGECILFPSKNQRDWNKFRVNNQVDKLEEHGHIITKKDKNNMIQTKYKRIPFNIELAKKITNKEVKGSIVTRNGLKVRIICFNRKERKDIFDPLKNIVALIQYKVGDENGDEGVLTFRNNGMYLLNEESDFDLHIEVPIYSNFEPQKWQSCIVRDSNYEIWIVCIYCGKDLNGDPTFFNTSSTSHYCHWNYFLPLSNFTKRLIGTTKSYEQLIEELDTESTKNKQQ